MRNDHQNLMRASGCRKARTVLWLLMGLIAILPDSSIVCAAEEPVALEQSAQDNLIQLDGSASGVKAGERIFYKWKQVGGPTVQLMDPDSAKPGFYARQSGKYSFELTISDGKTVSAPAVVNVEVDKLNRAPIVQMQSRIEAREAEEFTLDASETRDPDGDELKFFWRQVSGPAVLGKDGYTSRPVRTLRAEREGVYVFELTVTDGTAKSSPLRCEVSVARNLVPVAKASAAGSGVMIRKITVTAGANVAENAGEQVVPGERPVARGDDGFPVPSGDDLLEKALEEGPETSLAKTYDPAVRPSATGARIKSMTVSRPEGSAGQQKPAPLRASAKSTEEDAKKLRASTSQDLVAEVGERVTIRGYGVSADGKRLKYIWKQTAGLPLSRDILNRSQNLEFIPAEAGMYIFELTVSDGQSRSEPAVVKVTVAGVNENLMGLVDDSSGAARDEGRYNNVEVPAKAPAVMPTPAPTTKKAAGAPEDIEVPGASSAPGANGKGSGLFSRIFKGGK